jgi:hypothetical protein
LCAGPSEGGSRASADDSASPCPAVRNPDDGVSGIRDAAGMLPSFARPIRRLGLSISRSSSTSCLLFASIALGNVLACSGDDFNAQPGNAGGAGSSGGAGAAGGSAGASQAGAAGESGSAGSGAGDQGGAAGTSTAGAGGTGTAGDSAGGSGDGGSGGGGGTAGDGGTGSGAGGSAGMGGGDAGAAGTDGNDACQILYVSTKGKATGALAGCTELNPLGSLDEALQRAADRIKPLPPVTEIQLCGGDYDRTSPLVLDRAIAIHGGYDCSKAAWTPPTDGNTTPTTFRYTSAIGVDIAKLSSGDGAIQLTDVTFQAVDSKTPLTEGTIGLSLRAGATATVRRARFLARQAQASGPRWGSVGVSLAEGASGTLSNNVFEGGPGSLVAGPTALFGSAGALLDRPAATLVFDKNTVRGGAGATDTPTRPGSVGLLLLGGDADVLLQDDVVTANTGRYVGAGSPDTNVVSFPFTASVGFGFQPVTQTSSGTATVLRGSIAAGTAESVSFDGGPNPNFFGLDARTVGVVVQSSEVPGVPPKVVLEQTRIYGGDVARGGVGLLKGSTFGLQTTNADVKLHSSLVHGGGILGNTAYARAAESNSSTWTIDGATLLPGIPTLPPGTELSPASFSSANAVGFFLRGKANQLTIRSTVLAALDASTGAFYGEGDEACGTLTGVGYEVKATNLYWLAPAASQTPPLGFFAGGTQPGNGSDCLSLVTAPEGPSTDGNAVHFPPGAGPASIQVFGGAIVSNDPPTIGGCTDTLSCLQVAFPGYAPAQHDTAIVLSRSDTKGATFRLACDGVPAVLKKGGTVASSPDLDLTGAARSGQIAPGAFDTTCP